MTSYTTLLLAYRQAKAALYREKRGVGMLALAQYEENLHRNLLRLQELELDKTWFESAPIGEVHIVPKSICKSSEPRDVIVVGAQRQGKVDLNVRVQLRPHPDFAIAEVMYLWEFGPVLDSLLSKEALGYRLHLVDGSMDKTSRDIYRFWPPQFERFRKDPLIESLRVLRSGESCTVTSLDFRAYYDSINPEFLIEPDFVDELSSAAVRTNRAFDPKRYVKATRTLLRFYERFRSYTQSHCGVDPKSGVPIGALSSRLIANVALFRFDARIAADDRTVCYRRYVDDIVIVRRAGNQPPSDAFEPLREVLPELDEKEDDVRVDIEVGKNVLSFQRTKTRTHHLTDGAGEDFVQMIIKSFNDVASERRAFATEIEPIAEELVALSGERSASQSRLITLRDADRTILETNRNSAFFASLRRTAKMLPNDEASKFFREHEGRITAGLDGLSAPEALDFALHVLSLSILARTDSVPRRVRNALALTKPKLKSIIDRLWFNGSEVKTGPGLASLLEYFCSRVEEAVCSAVPIQDDEESVPSFKSLSPKLSKKSVQRDARRLLAADLRLLDREDECLLHPGALAVRSELSDVERALERDGMLSKRLKKIAEFAACLTSNDPWQMPCVEMFLLTRPPSYFDISRRITVSDAPDVPIHRDALEVTARTVNAVTGSRYRKQPGRIVDENTINVQTKQPRGHARIMLGNMVLSEAYWKGGANGPPVLTHGRFDALRTILNDSHDRAKASKFPSLLLLPELAIPQRWVREVGRHVTMQGKLGIVYGTEYATSTDGLSVKNQAIGVFPGSVRTAVVVPWTKHYPADIEGRAIKKPFSIVATEQRRVVESNYGRLSTLICSELLEPQALAALIGKIELLLVPAWNQDTGSFDHVLRSAGLLVHTHVACANNGHYSDCRIWAPYGDPGWRRDIVRLIQRDENVVTWGDLDVGSLWRFHRRDGTTEVKPKIPKKKKKKGKKEPIDLSKVWKPKPPSWPSVR